MEKYSVFTQYEKEFYDKCSYISKEISYLNTLDKGCREKKLKDLKQLVAEAENLVKRLEREALQDYSALQGRCKDHKKTLTDVKSQVYSTKGATTLDFDAARLELGLDALSTQTCTQTQRSTLRSLNRAEESNAKLADCKNNLKECEDSAGAILKELGEQRDRIEHTKDMLGSINTNLQQSNSLLNSMSKRSKFLGIF